MNRDLNHSPVIYRFTVAGPDEQDVADDLDALVRPCIPEGEANPAKIQGPDAT